MKVIIKGVTIFEIEDRKIPKDLLKIVDAYKQACDAYNVAVRGGVKSRIKEKKLLLEKKKQALKEALESWLATADSQSKRGALTEAQLNFAVILQIAQEFFSQDPNDRSYYFRALNNMGIILKKQYCFKRALICFQEAEVVATTVTVAEVSDSIRITMLLNMNNLFSRAGRYREVFDCCERNIGQITSRKRSSDDEVLLRYFQHNKAIALLYLGKIEEASRLIEELDEYYKKQATQNHKTKLDVIRIMHDRGVAYCYEGLWEKALEQYQKALARYKTLQDGGEDVGEEIANEMNAIAVIHQLKKEYRLAHDCWLEALKIYDSKLKHGEDCYQVKDSQADIYNNLGLLYQNQDKLDEAMQYYQRALSIYQEVYKDPDDRFKVADTIHNVGLTLFRMGSYAEAIKKQEEALRFYTQIYGENHFKVVIEKYELARSHRRLAMVCPQSESQHHLDVAAELLFENLQKHRAWIDKLYKPFSVFELATYHNLLHELGMTYVMQGHPELAVAMFRDEVERFYCSTNKARDWSWSIAALRYCKKALYYLRMVDGRSQGKEMAKIYVMQAQIYRDRKQWHRAIICLEKAIAVDATDEAIRLRKDLDILESQLSHEMGDDLYQQLQEIRNRHEELQQLYIDELPKLILERNLPEYAKNMTTALIIQLDGLLDQSYDRFVQQAIYRPNRVLGGDIYFPIELSMEELQKTLETQLVTKNQRRIGSESLVLEKVKIYDLLFLSLKKAGYLDAENRVTAKWQQDQGLLDLDERCDPYRDELSALLMEFSRTSLGEDAKFAEVYLTRGIGDVLGIQLGSDKRPILAKKLPSHGEILRALIQKGYVIQKDEGYFFADAFTVDLLSQPLQLGANAEEMQRFINYERQIKTKLRQIFNNRSLEVTYQDCYHAIEYKQPFSSASKCPVISIIRIISNDSKHVRLAPQGFSENLAERIGQLRIGGMKIMLHYSSNPSAQTFDSAIEVSQLLLQGMDELEGMMLLFGHGYQHNQQLPASSTVTVCAPPAVISGMAPQIDPLLTPQEIAAQWRPVQSMKLEDLKQYHFGIKGVAKKYRVINQLELAGDLYCAAAMHVRERYPWLAAVYYDKAIREYRHLCASAGVSKLQVCCQQRRELLCKHELNWRATTTFLESDELCDEHMLWFQTLKQQAESPSSFSHLIDRDIYSQWEYAKEQYWKLLYNSLRLSLYFKQKPYLFIRLQNQAIDIMIKLRHILDQGFSRFVEEIIDKANGKARTHKDSRSTVHYLCAGSPKRLIEEYQRQGIVSQDLQDSSKDSLTKHTDVYRAVQESQPYYYHTSTQPNFWRQSWLEKLTYLSNKAKHVGWVSASDGFEQRTSDVTEVEQVFQVHCTEERVYDWAFRECFNGDVTMSKQLVDLLKRSNYLHRELSTIIDDGIVRLANRCLGPDDTHIQDEIKRLKEELRKKDVAFVGKISDNTWRDIVYTLLMLANPLLTLNAKIGWQPCASLIEHSLAGSKQLLTLFFRELERTRSAAACSSVPGSSRGSV